MARDGHPYERGAPTGKRIAVVGAGPAGLHLWVFWLFGSCFTDVFSPLEGSLPFPGR